MYAALRQPVLSLLFAKASLETCRQEKLFEVLATAFEAVARAYAVAEDNLSARKYLKRARDQLRTLDLGAEAMRVYSDQFDETEKSIAP